MGCQAGDGIGGVVPGVGSVAVLEIVPRDDVLFSDVGQRRWLDVIALDEHGRPFDGALSWRTTDASVASVSTDGEVTAAGAGSARVSVSGGGRQASIEVAVSVPVAVPVRVSESGLEGERLVVGSAFGSSEVVAGTIGSVRVSEVEDTLVVATTFDGRVFVSRVRPAMVAGAVRAAGGSTFVGIEVDSVRTAQALLWDHPLLSLNLEDANTATRDARSVLECLLDRVAFDACTSVFVRPETYLAFDALLSALLGSSHDFSSAPVQEALLDAALLVSEDFDAELGVDVSSAVWSDLTAVELSSGLTVRPVNRSPLGFALSIESGTRVKPTIRDGTWQRGVDTTFRFLQVDASRYRDRDQVVNAVLSGSSVFIDGWAEQRLVPLNSITKKASILTWLANTWSWLTSWWPSERDDPAAVALPRDGVFVVIGVTPGHGLLVRDEVARDRALMPHLPGVSEAWFANVVHNWISLGLDVYSLHSSFVNKASASAREKVIEAAVTCTLGKATPYYAEGRLWRLDGLESLSKDVVVCMAQAFATERVKEWADDVSSATIEGWKRYVSSLIEQAALMVRRGSGEVDVLARVDGSVERHAIITTGVVAALVKLAVKWEKGVKAAGAAHRVWDMVFRLAPLEIAVVEVGAPAYASDPPVSYGITVTPGAIVGSASAGRTFIGSFELENTGEGPIEITGIEPSADWVDVSPPSVPRLAAGGVLDVEVTLNASGLEVGSYGADVLISWGATDRSVAGSATVLIEFEVVASGDARVTEFALDLVTPAMVDSGRIVHGSVTVEVDAPGGALVWLQPTVGGRLPSHAAGFDATFVYQASGVESGPVVRVGRYFAVSVGANDLLVDGVRVLVVTAEGREVLLDEVLPTSIGYRSVASMGTPMLSPASGAVPQGSDVDVRFGFSLHRERSAWLAVNPWSSTYTAGDWYEHVVTTVNVFDPVSSGTYEGAFTVLETVDGEPDVDYLFVTIWDPDVPTSESWSVFSARWPVSFRFTSPSHSAAVRSAASPQFPVVDDACAVGFEPAAPQRCADEEGQ